MEIKISLGLGAITPTRASGGACGFDLYNAGYKTDGNEYVEYDTGVSIEIPEGYVGLVFPRSSISKLAGVSLANSVGVIDQDYRGTIKCRFRGNPNFDWHDRIAQLVLVPCLTNVSWRYEEQLTETTRGAGGFGSTNKGVN